MNFPKCSKASKDKIVSVQENGRTFIVENPNRATVYKIIIDGCLINDRRERCDYLVECYTTCNWAIFVELKGSDIKKAVSQLAKTIGYLSNRHKVYKKACHIVASRVPKAGPATQVLKAEFAKKYSTLLYVGTQQVRISLSKPPYF